MSTVSDDQSLGISTVLPDFSVSAGESIKERLAATQLHRRLIRNRRNISWYKEHSDFWGWYKYFTDNGNQEAVSSHATQHWVRKLCVSNSIPFLKL